MEIIKKILFGKKINFQDPKIGTLTTRIKSNNPSIEYTWTGEYLIDDQKKETVIILEGNLNGPHKAQLNSAYRIVDELDSIIERVDNELKENASNYKKIKNWKEEFYFAAVTPYDQRENKFELNFEPIDSNNNRYVSLIWSNGQINEVEGK
ncbi:hypothetical protein [Xanthovirga aplysinae]|uniref:hypothetical protein n=1 Tax=Xanthovirga aplysinae TaxID=2529853 RepID=UPI0012BC9433|nr:hypothetical protein [Xanthovirga aplysinae]MTI29520.1 hypothetical protein [Xanthovirga aplysinae]